MILTSPLNVCFYQPCELNGVTSREVGQGDSLFATIQNTSADILIAQKWTKEDVKALKQTDFQCLKLAWQTLFQKIPFLVVFNRLKFEHLNFKLINGDLSGQVSFWSELAFREIESQNKIQCLIGFIFHQTIERSKNDDAGHFHESNLTGFICFRDTVNEFAKELNYESFFALGNQKSKKIKDLHNNPFTNLFGTITKSEEFAIKSQTGDTSSLENISRVVFLNSLRSDLRVCHVQSLMKEYSLKNFEESIVKVNHMLVLRYLLTMSQVAKRKGLRIIHLTYYKREFMDKLSVEATKEADAFEAQTITTDPVRTVREYGNLDVYY